MNFDLKKRLLIEKPVFPEGSENLWIHCSSVGEFNTLRPLLSYLKERFTLILTYFSPRAKAYLEEQKDLYDLLHPLPIDLPWTIRRFEEWLSPVGILIMERELWPSFIYFTKSRKILLNAYARGGILERLLSPHYHLIITRSDKDRKTFLNNGAKRVKTCGNLKTASFPPQVAGPDIKKNKAKLMVAGSTHQGEERLILKSLKEMIREGDLRIVIAPRHISRTEEIQNLADSLGLKAHRWTEKKEGWEILILDTLGDLTSFYSVCDVAFVGGTFVPVGGHNLLEPAFFDKPVLFGPHTEKVEDLERILIDLGLGFKVSTAEELRKKLLSALSLNINTGGRLRELGIAVTQCYLKEIFSELKKG